LICPLKYLPAKSVHPILRLILFVFIFLEYDDGSEVNVTDKIEKAVGHNIIYLPIYGKDAVHLDQSCVKFIIRGLADTGGSTLKAPIFGVKVVDFGTIKINTELPARVHHRFTLDGTLHIDDDDWCCDDDCDYKIHFEKILTNDGSDTLHAYDDTTYAKNGILCDVSGEDHWTVRKFPIVAEEINTSIEIQFLKNQSIQVSNKPIAAHLRESEVTRKAKQSSLTMQFLRNWRIRCAPMPASLGTYPQMSLSLVSREIK